MKIANWYNLEFIEILDIWWYF